MGLFGKSKKDKVIPNYRTVSSENGPVIDVFCLDGEGYNTINADDNLLFLSGMTYWQMKLSAYGCNTDCDVARSNASRFFVKLWDNKYYEKQPLVGWYMALYSVYHGNTWSEIAHQAMKVFCESVFQQPKLHTMEAWYLSMMYTSLCGGSIDDVVEWLHKHLENNISKILISDGASLVMPVLQHYKVLQGIVAQVPFDTPEVGGTLEGYWEYLADKFMCEEAKLEATLVRLFLAHSPYNSLNILTDDNAFMLDPEEETKKAGVKEEAALFNKAAKKGNPLALSFVYQTNWVYETAMNKTKYPSFDNIVLDNDDYIRKNRKNVFLQLYSEAKSTADSIASTGLALKQAEEHFAKGLYQVATGINFHDEMKKAASYAEKLQYVKLSEGRLNAAIRAAVCLNLVYKEEFPFLSKEDKQYTSKVEKLAIGCRKKPTELKFRELGMLLRDGFMGMHPQPDLWDEFRFKAFDTAKDYGITKYVLDDESYKAENLFKGMVNDSENKWSQKHITGAWLGLAWLRYSKEDYNDLSELVKYLERFEGFDDTIGRDNINSYIKAINDKDLMGIEPLAKKLTQDKSVHNDDPVIIDMGRLIARYLGCQYEKKMEKCKSEMERLALMTKIVDIEMTYAGYTPRLLDYIITGLDTNLEYFYSLLKCREVFDALCAHTNLEIMFRYVNTAMDKGCDLKEELAELNRKNAEKKSSLSAEELYNKASHYIESDPAYALSLLEEAAQMGYEPAQHGCGSLYYQGIGHPKDMQKSLYWYEKSANQGNADSQFVCGYRYHFGIGCEKDLKKAFYWYGKSAESGLPDGQYSYGVSYFTGLGCEVDYQKALYWYLKAAEQGFKNAQESCGYMYSNGYGCTLDKERALHWYLKAANQGHKEAQYQCGLLYHLKYHNTDTIEYKKNAEEWYRKAAAQGHDEALSMLKSMGVK